jgi:hypothetical protein
VSVLIVQEDKNHGLELKLKTNKGTTTLSYDDSSEKSVIALNKEIKLNIKLGKFINYFFQRDFRDRS